MEVVIRCFVVIAITAIAGNVSKNGVPAVATTFARLRNPSTESIQLGKPKSMQRRPDLKLESLMLRDYQLLMHLLMASCECMDHRFKVKQLIILLSL